jgi:hypothetical protein
MKEAVMCLAFLFVGVGLTVGAFFVVDAVTQLWRNEWRDR